MKFAVPSTDMNKLDDQLEGSVKYMPEVHMDQDPGATGEAVIIKQTGLLSGHLKILNKCYTDGVNAFKTKMDIAATQEKQASVTASVFRAVFLKVIEMALAEAPIAQLLVVDADEFDKKTGEAREAAAKADTKTAVDEFTIRMIAAADAELKRMQQFSLPKLQTKWIAAYSKLAQTDRTKGQGTSGVRVGKSAAFLNAVTIAVEKFLDNIPEPQEVAAQLATKFAQVPRPRPKDPFGSEQEGWNDLEDRIPTTGGGGMPSLEMKRKTGLYFGLYLYLKDGILEEWKKTSRKWKLETPAAHQEALAATMSEMKGKVWENDFLKKVHIYVADNEIMAGVDLFRNSGSFFFQKSPDQAVLRELEGDKALLMKAWKDLRVRDMWSNGKIRVEG